MKRTPQHLLIGLFLFVASLLAACGGGGGDAESGPIAAPTPPTSPPPPVITTTVRVKVLDVLGFAKPGARVATVGANPVVATTGADGTALLNVAPNTELLLQIELPGHTRQWRPVRVAAGAAVYLEARVMQRAPALTLPDAAAGGSLVGRNAARLTLPANALVDAETGAAVTGAVQVEMTPVNTRSHELRAFPGGMRAVSGTTQGQLVTYGPVEYLFTQGGRKLALAQGASAVIEMPLHATLDIDGTPLEPGETMPVWSLNETTGVWVQEGEGTVVASASATGLALRATVSHFSWWNPDHFSNTRQVNISFVFENGVTPTVCCHVEGTTTPGYPGPAGVASTTLPVSGGLVVVDTPSVYTFTATGLSAQGPLFGGRLDVTVPLGDGPFNLTITLGVDEDAPNPVITSPEAGVTTYTRGTLAVQASVSGGEPEAVALLVNGNVFGAMAGSQDSGYSIAWDTSGFSEGSYQIAVRATGENSVVQSTARTVVVDRTPPQLIGRGPAPGATEVGAADAIVASFNEPLDPQGLFNAESPPVRLVSGGTTLPLGLALSADGRTVTATPLQPLASNASYTVFVQGLSDRAGNTMVPEQWSFSVPLWALGSPDLRTPIAVDEAGEPQLGNVLGRPEIALASNGEPLLLWRQGTADGRFTLQAARRIGALWVPLPALLPDGLPNSAFGEQSMALDGSGQPVVAWTQTVPNTAGCNTTLPSQLFVARFDGSAWQRLGAGNLNIEPCALPTLPRLKVDAAGRPVLVSAQGPGGRTIQVLRFEAGAWALLGAVPVQTVPSLPLPITELRLALDGNQPYVLRTENRSGNLGHFVARLEDAAFVPVGPQVTTGNRDVRGALVIDAQGRPVVAVKAAAEALRVLRFEGGSWATVGGVLAASPFVNDPSIVFEGLDPIVAWRADGVAHVRRFDPVAQDWAPTQTLRTNIGALSELRRAPAGGPIWGALTTGPFASQLRAVTGSALP